MKETFYFTSGPNYELYLQVTDTTHFYDVITIIKNGDIWKEDKAEYNSTQYNALSFATKYQPISEEQFAAAQNNVLSTINQTRQSLRKSYFNLWTEYLIERIKLEELLTKSKIDRTDFYAVTNFKLEAGRSLQLEQKRDNLHRTYNENYNRNIFSNEDIFGKVATERLDTYLNRRDEILKI